MGSGAHAARGGLWGRVGSLCGTRPSLQDGTRGGITGRTGAPPGPLTLPNQKPVTLPREGDPGPRSTTHGEPQAGPPLEAPPPGPPAGCVCHLPGQPTCTREGHCGRMQACSREAVVPGPGAPRGLSAVRLTLGISRQYLLSHGGKPQPAGRQPGLHCSWWDLSSGTWPGASSPVEGRTNLGLPGGDVP